MISSSQEQTYIVAGNRPWNETVFNKEIAPLPGTWHFIKEKSELNIEEVKKINPRYIFFIHWSWIVPPSIFNHYECVCFHMTDLPYGRGGTPLQNLIIRGKRKTKLTALRMNETIDGGPVYLKMNLCLEGNAEEIYIRASRLSALMIKEIIEEKIEPQPQVGEVVNFERRKPADSEIPECPTLLELYDFIRMLDAQNYPKAFINYKGFTYKFTNASFRDGKIEARVKIRYNHKDKR